MKTSHATKRAGSVAKLAKILGITTAAIYQWHGEMPGLRAFQFSAWIAKQESKKAKK